MVTVRTDSYRINFGIQKDLHPPLIPAIPPTPPLRPTIDARTHARAIYTLVIHRATFLFAAFYPLVCIHIYIKKKTTQVQTLVLTQSVLFIDLLYIFFFYDRSSSLYVSNKS